MPFKQAMKALGRSLQARLKAVFVQDQVEEFARLVMARDFNRLASLYHGKLPARLHATDIAAFIEMHAVTELLLSQPTAADGVYIVPEEGAYQLIVMRQGHRQVRGVYQHQHAALIAYCQELLHWLRHTNSKDWPLGVQYTAALKGASPQSRKPSIGSDRAAGGTQRPRLVSSNQGASDNKEIARRAHLRLV
jgi:hypothetical protein